MSVGLWLKVCGRLLSPAGIRQHDFVFTYFYDCLYVMVNDPGVFIYGAVHKGICQNKGIKGKTKLIEKILSY